MNTTNNETGNESLLRHLSSAKITSTESISSFEKLTKVEVYPNPASTYSFVNLEDDKIQKVEVLSLSENLVSRQSPDENVPFVISSLDRGVCLVKLLEPERRLSEDW
ncbi:MAG: T9SS type A sorting domain-containing protein [Bacteroidota bacterium]